MKIVFTNSYRPLPVLISLFTLSKMSHSEFLFSDGISIYPTPYSARVMLTRKRYTSRGIYMLDLDIAPSDERVIRDWAESQLGVPYDYNSLVPPGLDMIVPRAKDNWKEHHTWMCSEFCAYGLDLIGWKLFPDDFKKIRPVDLYNRLLDLRKDNERIAYQ